MPDDRPILLNMRGNIAHCVLNAPPKNIMNMRFFNELQRLVRNEVPRFNARGMVIYGEGRHFSSGADIEELFGAYRNDTAAAEMSRYLEANQNLFCAIESLPIPVVAAVNGCCLGAGLELALACRRRIASPHAIFSLPETGYGIMPGCGGTIRLAERVGQARAVELILSGRIVAADEALSLGIIDEIVENKDCIAAAERLIMRADGALSGRCESES